MKILQRTYAPIKQTGPDDVRGHGPAPLVVNLPPATTIGDRVGVRSQPGNPGGYWQVQVIPDGSDTINGAMSFNIYPWGSCYTFVVTEVGVWGIESGYVAPSE
jgi:hypothetical protein